jgi:exopolysaccharide production protein ExoY
MSGFWQVSDRNDTDFTGRVRFDEMYDREVSMGTDLRVIAQTFIVVARGTGL